MKILNPEQTNLLFININKKLVCIVNSIDLFQLTLFLCNRLYQLYNQNGTAQILTQWTCNYYYYIKYCRIISAFIFY